MRISDWSSDVCSSDLIQLLLDSMIIGALVGFLIFSVSGVVRWRETDDLFTEGMKMMAMIGFIMIAASGFAEVMKATGEVQSLVETSATRSEEHTSELQSLMRISYAVFCLTKQKTSYYHVSSLHTIYNIYAA